MGIIFVWVILSIVVGFVAANKTITFWGGFLFSLLLSPVIGLVIALVSKDKTDRIREIQMEMNQRVLHNKLMQDRSAVKTTIADEIEKLKKQMDAGILSPEEFQQLKSKLIEKL